MDSIRCILVVVQALFCNGQYFLWNKGRSENLTKKFNFMLLRISQDVIQGQPKCFLAILVAYCLNY